MGQCLAWLKRLCCCCCCCCEENKETSPLLSGPSKETSPVPAASQELEGISEVRVASDQDGKEVQEIEVSVQESKDKVEDSPEVPTKRVSTLELSTDDGPSERARVDSGTFVRNSGSRSSWRLLPTVSQQARAAAATKEREEKEEKRKSAIITSSSNLGDGAIVFSDDAIDEDQKVVTLVSEEERVEVPETTASVTVTVTSTEITDGPTEVEGQEDAKEESDKAADDIS